MSSQAEVGDDVIVFDNLVRPTDVVGQYTELKALQLTSEPFSNPNAAGSIRQVDGRSDIQSCAKDSGARLKVALRPE